MSLIGLEVVHPKRRDDGTPLIVLNAQPRPEVLVAPHRRPTARATVAKNVAEVPQRPAEVDPPLILELRVEVRIRGPVGGEAVRGPELPPVEIPKHLLEHEGRLLPVQRRPVA